MKSRTSLCTAFFAFVAVSTLGFVPLSGATVDDPEVFLRRAVDEVLAVAFPDGAKQSSGSLADRMHPVLDRYLDFASITRRAIGPGWRRFTADEQQRALVAFSALVVRIYVARFNGEDRPRITYESSIELAPDRREIPTRVIYAGSNYLVGYRLERVPDGWRIYDIVIEGVSFVANYRAQFGALFQKGGPADVLRVLETKTVQPEIH